MTKYYINLPGGTKDSEFQQVLELLKSDQGYQEKDGWQKRRVLQPDGSYKEQGFLYLFDDRDKAETFAELVRKRTNNRSWKVFEVDEEPIQRLVEDHRQLQDEPLILAMYYDAGDDPKDIYLLEVLDNFGANGINPDRELFELTYWAPNRLEPDSGRSWHLILTNPKEFDTALRENWKHAAAIRRAVESGRYEVIYMDNSQGLRSRELIHA